MNDYISLRVELTPCSEDATDLLAAFLADAGYESFEPDATGLTAYIKAEEFDPAAVEAILADFPMEGQLKTQYERVEGRDWNEEWEKNYFQPILIDGECVIHSTFHKDLPEARYDIVIDPKMAFGTGHHATTSMMVRHLLKSDLQGKNVIDMGTGTGILAILAKMRGAASADGIEIDPGACVNARENVELNGVEVSIHEGDSSQLGHLEAADYFLANINRNVILADMGRYADAIKSGGTLILSGFYSADVALLERAAKLYGLTIEEQLTEDGDWTSLRLRKQ